MIVTGPPELREQLRHLPTPKIIAVCARLRPGHQLGDPDHAAKTALRRLARRHQQLWEEITEADHEIAQLVGEAAPALLALLGVGPEVAGQLLTSAGDNLDRITSEAAFAHLCGPAPVPAVAAAPTDTGWIAVGTMAPTMRSTLLCLAASATTHAPAPTPNAALTRDCRGARSSAA